MRAWRLALVAFVSACSTPAGPVAEWTEAPAGRPVIDRGPEGAWDHYAVDNPFVLVENGVFYCFYEGQDKPFAQGGRERCGLAISRDGLRWDKYQANPILDVGPAGAWDSRAAKIPVVSRHGDLYYLFYSGREGETKSIGLATSKDLRVWTKHPGNPVLRGRPNRWDRQISTHPAAVVERDKLYYLLYRGMTSFYREQGLGVAVSDNLIRWARAVDEPVLPPHEETSSLAVARMDGRFFALSQAPGRPCWTSSDLLHWTRHGEARFTAAAVDTVSNPFQFSSDWAVLYEQHDRIHRAVRTP